jgi:transposase
MSETSVKETTPVRRDWRIPDELWEQLEPLLPPTPPKPHPLGCHRKRVPNRQAMDGIFFVLRTGCQWNALNETGICSSSVAHSRFQEWTEAGVFEKLWAQGLAEYDAQVGIDWDWLSMDGAMTKAPGVEKKGPRRRQSAPTPPTEAKAEPSAAC